MKKTTQNEISAHHRMNKKNQEKKYVEAKYKS